MFFSITSGTRHFLPRIEIPLENYVKMWDRFGRVGSGLPVPVPAQDGEQVPGSCLPHWSLLLDWFLVALTLLSSFSDSPNLDII